MIRCVVYGVDRCGMYNVRCWTWHLHPPGRWWCVCALCSVVELCLVYSYVRECGLWEDGRRTHVHRSWPHPHCCIMTFKKVKRARSDVVTGERKTPNPASCGLVGRKAGGRRRAYHGARGSPHGAMLRRRLVRPVRAPTGARGAPEGET